MKKALFVFFGLLMAIQVIAVEFDVYGELHLGIWWDRRERWWDDTINIIYDSTFTSVDTTIDTTVVWGPDSLPVFNNSFVPHGKFGFTLKTDRVNGCIEMGIGDNVYELNLSGATGTKILKRTSSFLYLRKWYGDIIFNDYLSLLIGQDYVPANFIVSNQAFYDHNCLINLGCLYTGRIPMVQLTMGGEVGNAFSVKGRLACIKPDTLVISYKGSIESEVETKAPKGEGRIDVGYDGEVFGFNFAAAGGFERFYSLLRTDPSIPKDSFKVAVDNYVIGTELGVKIGPVTLNGTFSKSMNPATYGILVGNRWEWRGDNVEPKTKDIYLPRHDVVYDTTISGTDTTIVAAGYDIFNSNMMQFAAVIGVKPTDFLAFEAGFGYQTVLHEFELLNVFFNDRFAWYFQATVTLFEMFKITPEVGQFYWGKEYLTGGRFTYWGLCALFEF